MAERLRILDAGECALVAEFGITLDPVLGARVIALDRAVRQAAIPGVVETVPTYRSLMVHYDPLRVDRAALAARLAALDIAATPEGDGRHWSVPASYDADFAEDLAEVAAATGRSEAEVIATHAGANYRVAMFGFAPGWAYLTGLPPVLALPRRPSPRARIPGGSLIVAGGQALIAGQAMPSGWHILGRTPARMFDPARHPPVQIEVGDHVRFRPVTRDEFDDLARRAAAGEGVIELGGALP